MSKIAEKDVTRPQFKGTWQTDTITVHFVELLHRSWAWRCTPTVDTTIALSNPIPSNNSVRNSLNNFVRYAKKCLKNTVLKWQWSRGRRSGRLVSRHSHFLNLFEGPMTNSNRPMDTGGELNATFRKSPVGIWNCNKTGRSKFNFAHALRLRFQR